MKVCRGVPCCSQGCLALCTDVVAPKRQFLQLREVGLGQGSGTVVAERVFTNAQKPQMRQPTRCSSYRGSSLIANLVQIQGQPLQRRQGRRQQRRHPLGA